MDNRNRSTLRQYSRLPTLFDLRRRHFNNDSLNKTTTEVAMFADDTVLVSVNNFYEQAVAKLQKAADEVCNWARTWIIKVNKKKSVRIDFTLPLYNYIPTFIQRNDAARYLGMHIDKPLN